MKGKSAKGKGYRFEAHLVDVFKKELDNKAYRVAGSGAGLDKGDVRLPNLNIEVEAKNQATIHLLDWWEQTKHQNTGDNLTVLAVRNPKLPEFKETLIVLDLFDFIELIKCNQGVVNVETNLPTDLKYKLNRLIESAKSLIKEIDKNL